MKWRRGCLRNARAGAATTGCSTTAPQEAAAIDDGDGGFNVVVSAVPVPGSLLLCLPGVCAALLISRRRSRKTRA